MKTKNNRRTKFTAGLLMAVMLVVGVLGNVTAANAASISADQYLAKMEKVINKAKSYEMSGSATVKMALAGQSVTATSKVAGIVFNNPVKAKVATNTTLSMAGQKQTQKDVAYVKESNGKICVYTKNADGSYEETDVSEMFETAGTADVSTYSGAKIVKNSVKVNKINTVQISAEMTGSDMLAALQASGMTQEDLASLGIDFAALSPIKATYWIDKKTFRPVKASVDMSAFMNDVCAVLSKMLEESNTDNVTGTEIELPSASMSITCSYAKSTVTYKNFNKAKSFKFPAGCK